MQALTKFSLSLQLFPPTKMHSLEENWARNEFAKICQLRGCYLSTSIFELLSPAAHPLKLLQALKYRCLFNKSVAKNRPFSWSFSAFATGAAENCTAFISRANRQQHNTRKQVYANSWTKLQRRLLVSDHQGSAGADFRVGDGQCLEHVGRRLAQDDGIAAGGGRGSRDNSSGTCSERDDTF